MEPPPFWFPIVLKPLPRFAVEPCGFTGEELEKLARLQLLQKIIETYRKENLIEIYRDQPSRCNEAGAT
jgi:hypothetical protein